MSKLNLVVSFCLILSAPFLNDAQSGFDANSFSDICDCKPTCSPFNGSFHCKNGRSGSRKDCPCCRVCLRQEGETCRQPENPCDLEAGLTCSQKGVCQAESDAPKLPEDGRCRRDEECEEHLFCLAEKCTNPCVLLKPCEGHLKGGECVTRAHQPRCECPRGAVPSEEVKACVATHEKTFTSPHVSPLRKVGCEAGQTFYSKTCEESCKCEPSGISVCRPLTCPPGLFPIGSSKDKKLCIELKNHSLTDECCVVVLCGNDPAAAATGKSQRKLDLSESLSEDDYLETLRELESTLNGNRTIVNVAEAPLKETKVEMIHSPSTTTKLTSKNDQHISSTLPSGGPDQSSFTQHLNTTVEDNEMSPIMTPTKDLSSNLRMNRNEMMSAPKLNLTSDPNEYLVTNTTQITRQKGKDEEKEEGNDAEKEEGGQLMTTSGPEREKESKSHGKFSSKADLVKVKNLTQNSTTMLLPSSAGGVLHYKESRSDMEASKRAVGTGEQEVAVTGLSPSTKYTFKWVGQDSTSSKFEIKTEDGCLQSGVSYPVGAKWHDGCQTTCMCHVGGASDCTPRCIFTAGAIQDEDCEERPSASDPECCVEYVCQKRDNSVLDSSVPSKVPSAESQVEPKLIVTSRTHQSVTVAWDDFRAGDQESDYVAEYRQAPSTVVDAKIPWMKMETSTDNPPPTMTIGKLKPNTLYEVRVGIYGNQGTRKLTGATETITVRTEPGCVHGNSSFAVGDFFQGCEERCRCSKDGSVKCSKRCSIPYFKKGTFAHDPFCTEDKEDTDECCSLVMCAHGTNRGDPEEVLLDYDQCSNTVCGNNAVCVSWPTLTEAADGQKASHPGSCRCKKGFSGDPNNLVIGCQPDPGVKTEENSCNFKSVLYSPGEVFYDGCSYMCTCSNQKEIECQPRCKYPADTTSAEGDCSFLPDPDDSCCLMRLCNSTVDKNVNSIHPPTLTFDGCIHGNKTFAKNEKFTFSCDSKCTCLGFGDVSCSPRCPPIKEILHGEKERCQTLVDPEDSCCKVIICDNVATDVMRANISDDEALITVAAVDTTTMRGKHHKSDSMAKTNDNMVIFDDDKDNITNAGLIKHDKAIEDASKNHMDIWEISNLNETVGIADKMGNNRISSLSVDEELTNARHHVHEAIGDKVNKSLGGKAAADETDTDEMNSTLEVSARENDILLKKPRLDDVFTSPSIEITEIKPIDLSTVEVVAKVSHDILAELLSGSNEYIVVSYSHNSLTWNNRTVPVKDIAVENGTNLLFTVTDLQAYKAYQFRVRYREQISPISKAVLNAEDITSGNDQVTGPMCEFKGKFYKVVENFYDGCTQFCRCAEDLVVHCVPIECPEHFGLDIFDPGCLEWENDPLFVASPPRCCGQKPKCALHIDHLSCTLNGHTFQHLDFIPRDMAGCDQRCQCISAKLECENLCSPVQATPPFHLPCKPSDTRIATSPTFPCCRKWECLNISDVSDDDLPFEPINFPHKPPPFIHVAGPPSLPPGISTPVVQHDSVDSIRIFFAIPNTFLGLPGGIYLRFTPDAKGNPNPLDWESEIIHEDGVTLEKHYWEYAKRNLQPGTNYTMQLVLSSHLTKAEIVSPNFLVQMPQGDLHTADIDLDPELDVSDVTSTSVRLAWTPLNDHELRYVDGIRVKYWSSDNEIPSEGETLHRTADNVVLRDLKSNTEYVASLLFIPPGNVPLQMRQPHNITFETLPGTSGPVSQLERLNLDAELSFSEIMNTSAKISWKRFSDFELQYIDGIRVRYWSGNKRFPKEGPMLHREADSMVLKDLEPDTKYTVDLFFMPHEGLTTAILNTKNMTFSTLPKEKDKYAFNITISEGEVSQMGVQILYSGVAEPEGKFINVFRVVYTTDGDSHDSQKFKVPKNQKEGYILLTDLKPNVEYEVWLEAYLTNGAKKKSNVITVITEYGSSPQTARNESQAQEKGSFYSAFVVVSILVALACLIIFGLLVLLLRRQNHAKANISIPKGTTAAYDNPSYKASEGNYAMEMNGLKNTTNGGSLAIEEP